jgi:hypothetical protein
MTKVVCFAKKITEAKAARHYKSVPGSIPVKDLFQLEN